MKECICCHVEFELEDLILLNVDNYKCAPCIKNEKVNKKLNWDAFKLNKLQIINNLLLELDAIDILDDIVMKQKIRQINDAIFEIKYYCDAN